MMTALDTFRLKEEHLKLLRAMWVDWDSAEYGAPCIDSKRPYGNSYVEGDVCEILGWKSPDEEEETVIHGARERRRDARFIHEETETALQILLCFAGQAVTPGLYRQKRPYVNNEWERIGD